MVTMFCLGRSYQTAKCMVQNRSASNLASDDHEWVGLHGDSIEGANLAIINRRKPPSDYERDTFKLLAPANSQILDAVWPGPAAVIPI